MKKAFNVLTIQVLPKARIGSRNGKGLDHGYRILLLPVESSLRWLL